MTRIGSSLMCIHELQSIQYLDIVSLNQVIIMKIILRNCKKLDSITYEIKCI